jgi:hypothetical protein
VDKKVFDKFGLGKTVKFEVSPVFGIIGLIFIILCAGLGLSLLFLVIATITELSISNMMI